MSESRCRENLDGTIGVGIRCLLPVGHDGAHEGEGGSMAARWTTEGRDRFVEWARPTETGARQ